MTRATHVAVAMLFTVGILAGTTACSEAGTQSTPGATAATVQPVTVGQAVTAEQAAALPKGQKAYEMADKSLVVTQVDQPLPAVVIAEVQAKTAAAQAATSTAAAATMAAIQAGNALSYDTGKQIVPVIASFGQVDTEAQHWMWTSDAGAPQDDLATAQAQVATYIARQSDPANYEMVVFPNGT